MPEQEPTSSFEHLTKNVFARVGTVVTAIAAVATALHQLSRDILLTVEGLVVVLALVSSAFVVAWRSNHVVADKKVSAPAFPRTHRLIAGAVLLAAIVFAVPYTIQIANIVIQRDQEEKQLAAIPFLTLTPQPTATATATPPPGAGQTATAVARSAWPLILSDSFLSNASGWRTGFTDFGNATTNRTMANGKYRLEMMDATAVNFDAWGTPNLRPVSDIFATLDAQRVSGPTKIGYGIYFRMSDPNNYYVFFVTDDREIVLQAIVDNKTIQLTRLSQVPAIKPGGVNRLGVVAQGTHIEALVNDQLVTAVDDTHFKEGKVAFWAGYLSAGEQAIFEFSNLQIRAP